MGNFKKWGEILVMEGCGGGGMILKLGGLNYVVEIFDIFECLMNQNPTNQYS